MCDLKCATTTRVSDVTFTVQGTWIPNLAYEESYPYLGVPIGILSNTDDITTLTTTVAADLEKIRQSLLAPWQKLDAIRTFIQPSLTYGLRDDKVSKASLTEYRRTLVMMMIIIFNEEVLLTLHGFHRGPTMVSVLPDIFHLPERAITEYFFASKMVGGLGFQDPFDERHVQSLVHTLKMLSSSDPTIHVARA